MSFTSGSTGGKYNVTLNVNQIPAHNHQLDRHYSPNTSHYHQGSGGVSDGPNPKTGSNKLTSYETGGNQSHENRMPYIVVYFFRRTA